MPVTQFPSQRKAARQDSPALVHQFLITLSCVDPLVWRRIHVPQSYTFWDLHVAIQDVMGWEDRHLHEFRLLDDRTNRVISIGLPTDMTPPDRPVAQGWTVPLSRHFESREWLGLPILYAYDFGDGWEHALIHEGMQIAKRSVKYPRCVSGAHRCPPEDCGGPHGYAELLKIIASPEHPRHKSMVQWLRGPFDPDSFDPKRVAFDNPQERWTKAFRQ